MSHRPEHRSIAFLSAPRLSTASVRRERASRYVHFAAGFVLALLLMVAFA